MVILLFEAIWALAQPPNDRCIDNIFIYCEESVIFGSNIGSEGAPPACGPAINKPVWYEITGINGEITVSTCNPGTDFDSQIGIYINTCFNLICVDDNNDDPTCGQDPLDATVTWTSILGEIYYVAVGGVSGTEGAFELSISKDYSATTCNIQCISTSNLGFCQDQGTLDWTDDTFTADVTVEFTDAPSTGDLVLSGSVDPPTLVSNVSVPASTISPGATAYVFEDVLMKTNPNNADRDISLTATFTANPSCTLTIERAGPSKHQCSVCQAGSTGGGYPSCWPQQDTTKPCTQSINYAPDPNFPEHTPIRYIKTVLHIMQKEDPAQLGQWKIHPTDPGNFTIEHIDLIRSWFNDPAGSNGMLGNLCDDPTDSSPHMTDSRIRLYNTGTVGTDIFFHPDNKGWGVGHFGGDCSSNSISNYFYDLRPNYIESPDINNPDYLALIDPETQDAFHVFITGGKWVPQGSGNDSIPDEDDCYWPCGGGATANMGCTGGGAPPQPLQVTFGAYNAWIAGNTPGEQLCEVDYPGNDAALGGMLGEIFHVLSVDHISPLQAHVRHPNGEADGCADTPWKSMYNRLGCDHANRCALTQCQIGRMHHFFAELKPAFERFPDGSGGFSRTLNLCDITEPTIVIPDGADVIWSGPRNLRTNVVIESGGKLTITCDIGMPTDAGFTVESGGRLTIDGARIYNNCDGEYWRGIEVEGTAQQQFPLLNNGQGFLKLNADSKLERAAFPIQVGQGGLVIATYTDFINCGLIAFRDYERNSLSQFSNCEFTRDNDFIDYGDWPNQIFLRSVKGITVSDCSFQTINPDGNADNGMAIEAYNSSFTARKSDIEGYRVGIWGYSWMKDPISKFTVKQCTLTDNRVGIANWANNNIIIEDNVIQGIGNHNQPGDHRGLTLRNCTGFTVEGNTFIGTGGGLENPNLIGIWAVNTGSESNEIWDNDFKKLYAANQAEENNRGTSAIDGLQYFCNTNIDENGFDFLVFDVGIAVNQGSEEEATKNVFSHYNPALGDFNNQSLGAINYFHTDAQEETPLDGYYLNIEPMLTEQAVDCSDSGSDHDTPLSGEEEEAVIHKYDEAKIAYDALQATYEGLLNGGNPEGTLAAEVEAATSGEADQLAQDLMGYAPYLTKKVLEEVAKRSDIFSDNDLEDILAANPDELRAPGLQAFLYAELDEGLVDNILEQQGEITERTALEGEIAKHRRAMHQSANRILKSELADTTGLDLAKYRLWLSNKGSLEAEYEIAGTYIMEGDYAKARETRDKIPVNFVLTEEALTEHTHYYNLSEVAIGALENGVHYSELGTPEVLQVQAVADNSTGPAGTMAQGLLNVFYGYQYEFTPKIPQGGHQRPAAAPGPGYNDSAISAYQPLTAMPNPAKDAVIFYYNLKGETAAAALQVYDINGQAVKTFELESQKGHITWEAGGFARGVYYCKIEQQGKAYPALKLVLMK